MSKSLAALVEQAESGPLRCNPIFAAGLARALQQDAKDIGSRPSSFFSFEPVPVPGTTVNPGIAEIYIPRLPQLAPGAFTPGKGWAFATWLRLGLPSRPISQHPSSFMLLRLACGVPGADIEIWLSLVDAVSQVYRVSIRSSTGMQGGLRGGKKTTAIECTVRLAAGVWHHLVVSQTQTAMSLLRSSRADLYVNSRLATEQDLPCPPLPFVSAILGGVSGSAMAHPQLYAERLPYLHVAALYSRGPNAATLHHALASVPPAILASAAGTVGAPNDSIAKAGGGLVSEDSLEDLHDGLLGAANLNAAAGGGAGGGKGGRAGAGGEGGRARASRSRSTKGAGGGKSGSSSSTSSSGGGSGSGAGGSGKQQSALSAVEKVPACLMHVDAAACVPLPGQALSYHQLQKSGAGATIPATEGAKADILLAKGAPGTGTIVTARHGVCVVDDEAVFAHPALVGVPSAASNSSSNNILLCPLWWSKGVASGEPAATAKKLYSAIVAKEITMHPQAAAPSIAALQAAGNVAGTGALSSALSSPPMSGSSSSSFFGAAGGLLPSLPPLPSGESPFGIAGGAGSAINSGGSSNSEAAAAAATALLESLLLPLAGSFYARLGGGVTVTVLGAPEAVAAASAAASASSASSVGALAVVPRPLGPAAPAPALALALAGVGGTAFAWRGVGGVVRVLELIRSAPLAVSTLLHFNKLFRQESLQQPQVIAAATPRGKRNSPPPALLAPSSSSASASSSFSSSSSSIADESLSLVPLPSNNTLNGSGGSVSLATASVLFEEGVGAAAIDYLASHAANSLQARQAEDAFNKSLAAIPVGASSASDAAFAFAALVRSVSSKGSSASCSLLRSLLHHASSNHNGAWSDPLPSYIRLLASLLRADVNEREGMYVFRGFEALAKILQERVAVVSSGYLTTLAQHQPGVYELLRRELTAAHAGTGDASSFPSSWNAEALLADQALSCTLLATPAAPDDVASNSTGWSVPMFLSMAAWSLRHPITPDVWKAVSSLVASAKSWGGEWKPLFSRALRYLLGEHRLWTAPVVLLTAEGEGGTASSSSSSASTPRGAGDKDAASSSSSSSSSSFAASASSAANPAVSFTSSPSYLALSLMSPSLNAPSTAPAATAATAAILAASASPCPVLPPSVPASSASKVSPSAPAVTTPTPLSASLPAAASSAAAAASVSSFLAHFGRVYGSVVPPDPRTLLMWVRSLHELASSSPDGFLHHGDLGFQRIVDALLACSRAVAASAVHAQVRQQLAASSGWLQKAASTGSAGGPFSLPHPFEAFTSVATVPPEEPSLSLSEISQVGKEITLTLLKVLRLLLGMTMGVPIPVTAGPAAEKSGLAPGQGGEIVVNPATSSGGGNSSAGNNPQQHQQQQLAWLPRHIDTLLRCTVLLCTEHRALHACQEALLDSLLAAYRKYEHNWSSSSSASSTATAATSAKDSSTGRTGATAASSSTASSVSTTNKKEPLIFVRLSPSSSSTSDPFSESAVLCLDLLNYLLRQYPSLVHPAFEAAKGTVNVTLACEVEDEEVRVSAIHCLSAIVALRRVSEGASPSFKEKTVRLFRVLNAALADKPYCSSSSASALLLLALSPDVVASGGVNGNPRAAKMRSLLASSSSSASSSAVAKSTQQQGGAEAEGALAASTGNPNPNARERRGTFSALSSRFSLTTASSSTLSSAGSSASLAAGGSCGDGEEDLLGLGTLSSGDAAGASASSSATTNNLMLSSIGPGFSVPLASSASAIQCPEALPLFVSAFKAAGENAGRSARLLAMAAPAAPGLHRQIAGVAATTTTTITTGSSIIGSVADGVSSTAVLLAAASQRHPRITATPTTTATTTASTPLPTSATSTTAPAASTVRVSPAAASPPAPPLSTHHHVGAASAAILLAKPRSAATGGTAASPAASSTAMSTSASASAALSFAASRKQLYRQLEAAAALSLPSSSASSSSASSSASLLDAPLSSSSSSSASIVASSASSRVEAEAGRRLSLLLDFSLLLKVRGPSVMGVLRQAGWQLWLLELMRFRMATAANLTPAAPPPAAASSSSATGGGAAKVGIAPAGSTSASSSSSSCSIVCPGRMIGLHALTHNSTSGGNTSSSSGSSSSSSLSLFAASSQALFALECLSGEGSVVMTQLFPPASSSSSSSLSSSSSAGSSATDSSSSSGTSGQLPAQVSGIVPVLAFVPSQSQSQGHSSDPYGAPVPEPLQVVVKGSTATTTSTTASAASASASASASYLYLQQAAESASASVADGASSLAAVASEVMASLLCNALQFEAGWRVWQSSTICLGDYYRGKAVASSAAGSGGSGSGNKRLVAALTQRSLAEGLSGLMCLALDRLGRDAPVRNISADLRVNVFRSLRYALARLTGLALARVCLAALPLVAKIRGSSSTTTTTTTTTGVASDGPGSSSAASIAPPLTAFEVWTLLELVVKTIPTLAGCDNAGIEATDPAALIAAATSPAVGVSPSHIAGTGATTVSPASAALSNTAAAAATPAPRPMRAWACVTRPHPDALSQLVELLQSMMTMVGGTGEGGGGGGEVMSALPSEHPAAKMEDFRRKKLIAAIQQLQQQEDKVAAAERAAAEAAAFAMQQQLIQQQQQQAQAALQQQGGASSTSEPSSLFRSVLKQGGAALSEVLQDAGVVSAGAAGPASKGTTATGSGSAAAGLTGAPLAAANAATAVATITAASAGIEQDALATAAYFFASSALSARDLSYVSGFYGTRADAVAYVCGGLERALDVTLLINKMAEDASVPASSPSSTPAPQPQPLSSSEVQLLRSYASESTVCSSVCCVLALSLLNSNTNTNNNSSRGATVATASTMMLWGELTQNVRFLSDEAYMQRKGLSLSAALTLLSESEEQQAGTGSGQRRGAGAAAEGFRARLIANAAPLSAFLLPSRADASLKPLSALLPSSSSGAALKGQQPKASVPASAPAPAPSANDLLHAELDDLLGLGLGSSSSYRPAASTSGTASGDFEFGTASSSSSSSSRPSSLSGGTAAATAGSGASSKDAAFDVDFFGASGSGGTSSSSSAALSSSSAPASVRLIQRALAASPSLPSPPQHLLSDSPPSAIERCRALFLLLAVDTLRSQVMIEGVGGYGLLGVPPAFVFSPTASNSAINLSLAMANEVVQLFSSLPSGASNRGAAVVPSLPLLKETPLPAPFGAPSAWLWEVLSCEQKTTPQHPATLPFVAPSAANANEQDFYPLPQQQDLLVRSEAARCAVVATDGAKRGEMIGHHWQTVKGVLDRGATIAVRGRLYRLQCARLLENGGVGGVGVGGVRSLSLANLSSSSSFAASPPPAARRAASTGPVLSLSSLSISAPAVPANEPFDDGLLYQQRQQQKASSMLLPLVSPIDTGDEDEFDCGGVNVYDLVSIKPLGDVQPPVKIDSHEGRGRWRHRLLTVSYEAPIRALTYAQFGRAQQQQQESLNHHYQQQRQQQQQQQQQVDVSKLLAKAGAIKNAAAALSAGDDGSTTLTADEDDELRSRGSRGGGGDSDAAAGGGDSAQRSGTGSLRSRSDSMASSAISGGDDDGGDDEDNDEDDDENDDDAAGSAAPSPVTTPSKDEGATGVVSSSSSSSSSALVVQGSSLSRQHSLSHHNHLRQHQMASAATVLETTGASMVKITGYAPGKLTLYDDGSIEWVPREKKEGEAMRSPLMDSSEMTEEERNAHEPDPDAVRPPSRPRRWSVDTIVAIFLRCFRLQDCAVEVFLVPYGGPRRRRYFFAFEGGWQARDKFVMAVWKMMPRSLIELVHAKLGILGGLVSGDANINAGNSGYIASIYGSVSGNRIGHAYVQAPRSFPVAAQRFAYYELLYRRQMNELTNAWKSRRLSNFDYLMALNTMAGRSGNDLNQYHVLPWVLSDYLGTRSALPGDSGLTSLDLTRPSSFRDLQRPMGALTLPRLREFRSRWDALGDDEGEEGAIPRFLYGSHFSTGVGTVTHFLIRNYPFTKIHLAYQDGHFDVSDRLFNSVLDAWHLNTTSLSEVKELTPEFYTSPSFLINNSRYRFGNLQDGSDVDHVRLPPWAKSPQHFVRVMRAALESDYVSSFLHNWIDLMFGHKQRGPASVEALNCFYYLTYTNAVDIDAIEEPALKKATQMQIVHYGQNPLQLLRMPHPPRGPHPLTYLPAAATSSSSSSSAGSSQPLPAPIPASPSSELLRALSSGSLFTSAAAAAAAGGRKSLVGSGKPPSGAGGGGGGGASSASSSFGVASTLRNITRTAATVVKAVGAAATGAVNTAKAVLSTTQTVNTLRIARPLSHDLRRFAFTNQGGSKRMALVLPASNACDPPATPALEDKDKDKDDRADDADGFAKTREHIASLPFSLVVNRAFSHVCSVPAAGFSVWRPDTPGAMPLGLKMMVPGSGGSSGGEGVDSTPTHLSFGDVLVLGASAPAATLTLRIPGATERGSGAAVDVNEIVDTRGHNAPQWPRPPGADAYTASRETKHIRDPASVAAASSPSHPTNIPPLSSSSLPSHKVKPFALPIRYHLVCELSGVGALPLGTQPPAGADGSEEDGAVIVPSSSSGSNEGGVPLASGSFPSTSKFHVWWPIAPSGYAALGCVVTADTVVRTSRPATSSTSGGPAGGVASGGSTPLASSMGGSADDAPVSFVTVIKTRPTPPDADAVVCVHISCLSALNAGSAVSNNSNSGTNVPPTPNATPSLSTSSSSTTSSNGTAAASSSAALAAAAVAGSNGSVSATGSALLENFVPLPWLALNVPPKPRPEQIVFKGWGGSGNSQQQQQQHHHKPTGSAGGGGAGDVVLRGWGGGSGGGSGTATPQGQAQGDLLGLSSSSSPDASPLPDSGSQGGGGHHHHTHHHHRHHHHGGSSSSDDGGAVVVAAPEDEWIISDDQYEKAQAALHAKEIMLAQQQQQQQQQQDHTNKQGEGDDNNNSLEASLAAVLDSGAEAATTTSGSTSTSTKKAQQQQASALSAASYNFSLSSASLLPPVSDPPAKVARLRALRSKGVAFYSVGNRANTFVIPCPVSVQRLEEVKARVARGMMLAAQAQIESEDSLALAQIASLAAARTSITTLSAGLPGSAVPLGATVGEPLNPQFVLASTPVPPVPEPSDATYHKAYTLASACAYEFADFLLSRDSSKVVSTTAQLQQQQQQQEGGAARAAVSLDPFRNQQWSADFSCTSAAAGDAASSGGGGQSGLGSSSSSGQQRPARPAVVCVRVLASSNVLTSVLGASMPSFLAAAANSAAASSSSSSSASAAGGPSQGGGAGSSSSSSLSSPFVLVPPHTVLSIDALGCVDRYRVLSLPTTSARQVAQFVDAVAGTVGKALGLSQAALLTTTAGGGTGATDEEVDLLGFNDTSNNSKALVAAQQQQPQQQKTGAGAGGGKGGAITSRHPPHPFDLVRSYRALLPHLRLRIVRTTAGASIGSTPSSSSSSSATCSLPLTNYYSVHRGVGVGVGVGGAAPSASAFGVTISHPVTCCDTASGALVVTGSGGKSCGGLVELHSLDLTRSSRYGAAMAVGGGGAQSGQGSSDGLLSPTSGGGGGGAGSSGPVSPAPAPAPMRAGSALAAALPAPSNAAASSPIPGDAHNPSSSSSSAAGTATLAASVGVGDVRISASMSLPNATPSNASAITAVALDNDTLVVGCSDGSAMLWRISGLDGLSSLLPGGAWPSCNSRPDVVLKGPGCNGSTGGGGNASSAIISVSLSRDDDLGVVCTSTDVWLYELARGKPLQEIPVASAAFAPVLTSTFASFASSSAPTVTVGGAAINCEGGVVVAANWHGNQGGGTPLPLGAELLLFDSSVTATPLSRPVARLVLPRKPSPSHVTCITRLRGGGVNDWEGPGALVGVGTSEGDIFIVDAKSLVLLASFRSPPSSSSSSSSSSHCLTVHCLDLSPDMAYLVAGCSDGVVAAYALPAFSSVVPMHEVDEEGESTTSINGVWGGGKDAGSNTGAAVVNTLVGGAMAVSSAAMTGVNTAQGAVRTAKAVGSEVGSAVKGLFGGFFGSKK